MNTIDILGEEETFRNIVERTIIEFEDNEIEAIKNSAFRDCSALTSVSLPAVTSIGDSAFSNCSALTSVSLPLATSIGNYAFYYCSSLTTLYIGTKSDAVCTLSNTNAIPSNIDAIYVPYNLVEKYKTATNWSSFADKIQGYEQPVACQSLTITAEDAAYYQTSTTVYWEATCTYSIEGMMQSGTMVFKGSFESDSFEKNTSDSQKTISVSYTFLGITAETTFIHDRYREDLVGGPIFYIDNTSEGIYEFYNVDGSLIPEVKVGDRPYAYKVVTPGTKDKYYVCNTTLYPNSIWTYYKNGSHVFNSLGATGIAIGKGKTNTATVMAADEGAYIAADSKGYPTIWYQLQLARDAAAGGCDDWFVPSKNEMDEVRKSGLLPFSGKFIWASSEASSSEAWNWNDTRWKSLNYKSSKYSVFFTRAF